MVRLAWVSLSLFASLPLFASNWQERKAEALATQPVLRAAKQAGKVLVVDCTKGQSVQEAIDKNASPLEIEIHGLCIESVLIQDKVVTLRGVSPATDGIRSPTNNTAVIFVDSNGSRVENLALSNNSGRAVTFNRSTAVMSNCVIDGNNTASGTGPAVMVSNSSFVSASAVTASNNVRAVFHVNTNSSFFCHGCDFSNNGGFAAISNRGSLLSLLNSTVVQRDGIQSIFDSYADIDCVTEVSAHPCGMQATRRAAYVEIGGVVALFGSGDFTGRVEAHDNGNAQLLGARQIVGATEGPPQNFVTRFATMEVQDFPPVQSRVRATNVEHFGRMLIRNQSELNGAIVCTSKGDAWLDATVVQMPGSSVTGCN